MENMTRRDFRVEHLWGHDKVSIIYKVFNGMLKDERKCSLGAGKCQVKSGG